MLKNNQKPKDTTKTSIKMRASKMLSLILRSQLHALSLFLQKHKMLPSSSSKKMKPSQK